MANFQDIIARHMRTFDDTMENYASDYPALSRAAKPLPAPVAPVLGRDKELSELRLNLRNPEKANVILLGDPGSGKTALVQGFTHDANSTQYLTLTVDVERLAQDPNGDKDAEMANGLLDLVHETTRYSKEHDVIVALFMDEFHRIAMISPTAVEALKPILEKSASFGIRVIAATTFEEYDQWIAPNRALDQRLLRMDLPELSRSAVMNVLQSRAERYGVDKLASPKIYGEIYDAAKQFLPSNSQPRASIDILLNMVGNITKNEYMNNGELKREYSTVEELNINSEYPLSRPMLNRVIQRSYGIDIDNEVHVKEVKQAIRNRIFNQRQAVDMIISRLELSLGGFNDPTRPRISFLSTGPTGTGKALRDDEMIPTVTGYKQNGELVVGDKVFDKYGHITTVTGVYHKGLKQIYRVTLQDGRVIDCAGDHLWTYRSRNGNGSRNWRTASAEELYNKNLNVQNRNRVSPNFVIPQNGAVERPHHKFDLKPYEIGENIALGHKIDNNYLLGDIDQRWLMVQGMFDTRGYIVTNKSYQLCLDYERLDNEHITAMRRLLWSLGVMNVSNESTNYLCIRTPMDMKARFFGTDYEQLQKADEAVAYSRNHRTYAYDTVAIKAIELLDEQVPMTCIMVDNDEHLYQAGYGHIVTHNTELAKTITEALGIPLKRFDMSRYPRPEDAVDFADQLALAAWSAPNAYILIDEAEKSTKQCMNTLLQVLDDARLTSANNANRVISFAGTIINLTTNLGSEVFQHAQRFGDGSKDGYMDTDLIYKSLSDSPQFETAVLGRIDAIVPFKALPKVAIYQIAKRQLDKDLEIAYTPKRDIFISPDILPYIVIDRTSNDSEHGGARDAVRNVKNIITQQIAHYMALGKPECPITVRLDGTPRFRDHHISDVRAADVTVEECYDKSAVDALLAQLSQKMGKQIGNAGLFIPKSWSPQQIVNAIVAQVRKGSTSVKTTVDLTNTYVIDGHANLDIANNYSFIEQKDADDLAKQKAEARKAELKDVR